MLHYVSAFLELDEKIQPTIELSPNTNTISFKDINSTGKKPLFKLKVLIFRESREIPDHFDIYSRV